MFDHFLSNLLNKQSLCPTSFAESFVTYIEESKNGRTVKQEAR